MDILGITGVAGITVICMLAAQIIKSTSLDTKWLPAICGAMGCLPGILAMNIMREFPAQDYITSAAIGIVSGVAATGAQPDVKQLIAASNQEVDDKESLHIPTAQE